MSQLPNLPLHYKSDQMHNKERIGGAREKSQARAKQEEEKQLDDEDELYCEKHTQIGLQTLMGIHTCE